MKLFELAGALYFIGMVKYLLHLGLRNRTLFILASVMIAAGFALETVALGMRSAHTGHGPYTNMFEYCMFLAWVVFGVFLVAEVYFKIKPLGAFMTPLGFLTIFIGLLFSPEAAPSLPVNAYWLTLHRTLSFLAFGAFALVFASGVMYLIQERQLKSKKFGAWYRLLPALNVLDEANRLGIIFGFPIITVGAGAALAWSAQNYGRIMVNVSMVSLAVAWIIFAALTFGRKVLGWRGRRAAHMGIAGFLIVAISLVMHIWR